MSATAPLIHARGLRKEFGALTAVDGIDFDVQRGEAFGFLGPNGAGKSSTMRMIGCVSPPSGGTLRILDLDPVHDGPSIRARLGVVPQLDTLDMELTVRENLIIYGRYFGFSRKAVRERARRAARVRPARRARERPGRAALRRHEAAADDRAGARERARGAPARRADDRARPAGPPRRVGQALPPEAAGRDARPDDALHGRGRATLRPARRHGPRQDRRGRLAARADPAAARRARSSSFASRTRRRTSTSRPSTVGSRASRSCRTASSSTRTTATRSSLLRTSASTRRACSFDARTLEDVFLRLTGRTLVD